MSLSKVAKTNPNVLNYCRLKLELRQAILNFSKEIGLKDLPGKTITALKSNGFYVFCFIPLIMHTPDEVKREHLAEILKDPEKTNENDVTIGLSRFLNNFHRLMPGGFMRNYIRDPKDSSYRETFGPKKILRYELLFSRIDKLLNGTGFDLPRYLELNKIGNLLENVDLLIKEKMELPIFEALIGKFHYSRDELVG